VTDHPAAPPGDTLPLLTNATDLAAALGIRKHTVYELAREGRLPSVRIGRVVRFDTAAVRRFIEAGGTSDQTS
jgi:excisionase family DNA binding protein